MDQTITEMRNMLLSIASRLDHLPQTSEQSPTTQGRPIVLPSVETMAPPVRQDLRFETPSCYAVIQDKVNVDRTPISDPLTDGSEPSFL